MKEFFLELADYHHWANQRLMETLKKIPEQQLDQEFPSSFPSIRKTMFHLWDAEEIWLQRLKLQEKVILPSAGFTGNFTKFSESYLHLNKVLGEWIGKMTEQGLGHVVVYYNSRGNYNKNQVSAILMHVFNHAT
ncbi:MAG: DinB family protein, partial [Chitinophagaceae bacterium]